MFNLSKFQKIAEDKHTTTLKHEDGHEMRIIHSAIPKIQHEQLKRLKLADGGEIEKEKEASGKRSVRDDDGARNRADLRREAREEAPKANGTTEGYSEKGKATPVGKMMREKDLKEYRKMKGPNIKGFVDGGEVSDDSSTDMPVPQSGATHITINAAPAAPTNTSAIDYGKTNIPVAQPRIDPGLPNVAPNGQPNPANQMKNVDYIAKGQQDIDTSAAQTQAANETAYNKALTEQNQAVQNRMNDMADHVNEYRDFINQNPIQADRRNVGQRIGSAFAVALSGAPGKGNPALDYLNNQLHRDFEAQKENVNNQNNILGAYERLYGKGVAADAATKATLLDLYDHKNKQIAAQLGTPQAAVNAMKYSQDASLAKAKLLNDGAATSIPSLPGYNPGGHMAGSQPAQGQPSSSVAGGTGASDSWDGSSNDSFNNQSNAAPSKESEPDHILIPGADDHFKKLQYTPKAKEDFGAIQNQYNGAVQADKALSQIDDTFGKLSNETNGISGRVHRSVNPHAVGAAGAAIGGGLAAAGTLGLGTPLGIAGGAALGEGLGHGIKAATNTSANREYDSDQTALLGYISAALKGTNIGAGQIQEIVDSNSPEAGDSQALKSKKKQNIKDFIMNHTDTSLLKAWGLSKK